MSQEFLGWEGWMICRVFITAFNWKIPGRKLAVSQLTSTEYFCSSSSQLSKVYVFRSKTWTQYQHSYKNLWEFLSCWILYCLLVLRLRVLFEADKRWKKVISKDIIQRKKVKLKIIDSILLEHKYLLSDSCHKSKPQPWPSPSPNTAS